MNTEKTEILICANNRVGHDFIGKYDPLIRCIYTDLNAKDDEDNVVVFHHREMITILALIDTGIEPQLAAAIVGNEVIPLAETVSTNGDFQTADGTHWRLAIRLPQFLNIDPAPYFLWAVDQDGTPHDLESLNFTPGALTTNRLPAGLSAMIGKARADAADWSALEDLSPVRCRRELRARLTVFSAADHDGNPEFGIRAAHISEQGGIKVFDYPTNLGVAALVRLGVPPCLAAAIVDQDYAFAALVGGSFHFPDSRPYGHPDANWSPVDLIELRDGSKWAIMMADLGPIHNVDRYDAWSLRGKGRVIGNITLANNEPLHDPTRTAIKGRAKYRTMARLFKEMPA